jgi:hypothetical protein
VTDGCRVSESARERLERLCDLSVAFWGSFRLYSDQSGWSKSEAGAMPPHGVRYVERP